MFTVAQFSFWGNYLPRVFPVHLRGTGESFAANVGGRMFGTSAAVLTSYIMAPCLIAALHSGGWTATANMAYAAAAIGVCFVFLRRGRRLADVLACPQPKRGRCARWS